MINSLFFLLIDSTSLNLFLYLSSLLLSDSIYIPFFTPLSIWRPLFYSLSDVIISEKMTFMPELSYRACREVQNYTPSDIRSQDTQRCSKAKDTVFVVKQAGQQVHTGLYKMKNKCVNRQTTRGRSIFE